MNRENFADYLNNPSKLYQLSRAELRGLVIEHPFAPNLRVLYWLKAQLENDPAAEELLHQAAARTFDRRHLFLILQRDVLPQLSQEEREDILELKALSELEKELLPVETPRAEAPSVARNLDSTPPGGGPAPAPLTGAEEDEEPELRVTVPAAPPRYRLPEHLLANIATVAHLANATPEVAVDRPFELEPLIPAVPAPAPQPTTGYRATPHQVADIVAALRSLAALPDAVGATEKLAPLPKDRFRAWRERGDRRAVLRHRLLDRARRQAGVAKEESKEVTEAEVRNIARQSVARPEGVASETLARIMIEQGKYRRAIAMYRELSLRYPEKSATFAAIIDELQQKH